MPTLCKEYDFIGDFEDKETYQVQCKCRIIFGIKCDGGRGEGSKEDIRKGMRISSFSANTFANASASFKSAKLVRNICNRKGVQSRTTSAW
jgi:hypothetical protein